ncbi:MAG: MlaD family protein [Succinivibrionaceae bacterium]|nr:MlaD family protein [Succinivibrionaceae bacterium]
MEGSDGKRESGARTGRRRRFSLAWIIPVLALVATLLMLWDNTINKGVLIKVTLNSAEGIEAGNTAIKYRSFPVGRVERIELAEDFKSVIAWVRMDPDTDGLLRKDSKIWVVKARLEASSVSGLDTIMGGAYLQISAGSAEEKQTEFTALEDPPLNPYNERGTTVNIYSEGKNRVIEGSLVTHNGIKVGQVYSIKLDPGGKRVNYKVFINEPYDQLLKENTYFWTESGLTASFDGTGFKFKVESLVSVIEGTLAFGNIGPRGADEPMDLSVPKKLYQDYESAEAHSLELSPRLVVLFDRDPGRLREGSRVYYRGEVVGQIIDPIWAPDREVSFFPASEKIPLLISIYADTLEQEREINEIISEYVGKHSVCAHPYSESLISGQNSLSLEFEGEGKCKCPVKEINGVPVIPFVDRGGNPMESLNDVLADIKGMKLDDTALEGRKALAEMQRTLASMGKALEAMEQKNMVHEVTEAFKKFGDSLQQFKKTTQGYDQNGRVYKKLLNIMNQLEQTMRDLSPGVRDLGESPRSIIFGSGNDPVPGKRR